MRSNWKFCTWARLNCLAAPVKSPTVFSSVEHSTSIFVCTLHTSPSVLKVNDNNISDISRKPYPQKLRKYRCHLAWHACRPYMCIVNELSRNESLPVDLCFLLALAWLKKSEILYYKGLIDVLHIKFSSFLCVLRPRRRRNSVCDNLTNHSSK